MSLARLNFLQKFNFKLPISTPVTSLKSSSSESSSSSSLSFIRGRNENTPDYDEGDESNEWSESDESNKSDESEEDEELEDIHFETTHEKRQTKKRPSDINLKKKVMEESFLDNNWECPPTCSLSKCCASQYGFLKFAKGLRQDFWGLAGTAAPTSSQRREMLKDRLQKAYLGGSLFEFTYASKVIHK